jgi:serine/threonine-protein kinase
VRRRLDAGTQLAGYRILGLLGEGGMGLVYEAEHILLGRKAALKTLLAELVEDTEFRERFIRESQLVAAIDHPNIIPIYDAGESDGTAYIAMRFVDGSDLSELIRREGPLGLDDTISMLDQAAGALDAAHGHDLVHRDVKPANLLIDRPTDRVYLMDFGIAKEGRSPGLTKPGFFLGTMEYAAPEQIEGKQLGPAADLYAFGCLLFECLTGKQPFERDTDMALLSAHLLEPPPAISAARPDLPAALDDVIAKAMAKSEQDRYGSCRELIDAVRAAAGARPAPVDVAALPWEAAPADGGTKKSRAVALPATITRLIGRARDVEEISALLRSDTRLLTLTGLSGVGKTRLAIAAAEALSDEFDEIAFADLSSVTDAGLVGSAIATALGVEDAREESLSSA